MSNVLVTADRSHSTGDTQDIAEQIRKKCEPLTPFFRVVKGGDDYLDLVKYFSKMPQAHHGTTRHLYTANDQGIPEQNLGVPHFCEPLFVMTIYGSELSIEKT